MNYKRFGDLVRGDYSDKVHMFIDDLYICGGLYKDFKCLPHYMYWLKTV